MPGGGRPKEQAAGAPRPSDRPFPLFDFFEIGPAIPFGPLEPGRCRQAVRPLALAFPG
jgi:hypothetical protein